MFVLDGLSGGIGVAYFKGMNNITRQGNSRMAEEIRDMDTFARVYKERVRATLRKFGVRNPDLLNDLEQEVYLRMIDKKTLEVFDPEKGSFGTHVYQVIRTIALNFHRASIHDPLGKAELLMMIGEGGEEFLHPEVSKQLVEDGDEGGVTGEFLELLYKELAKEPVWRSKSSKGESIKSLSMVCSLMQRGFKPKEIASIFNVGQSSVSVWIKKIRTHAQRVREKMAQ